MDVCETSPSLIVWLFCCEAPNTRYTLCIHCTFKKKKKKSFLLCILKPCVSAPKNRSPSLCSKHSPAANAMSSIHHFKAKIIQKTYCVYLYSERHYYTAHTCILAFVNHLEKLNIYKKTCVTLGQIALNVFGVFCKHLFIYFNCKRLFLSLKKRHLQLLPSLCVLFIIPSAWAVVGHGSNVNRRSSYNASPKKVIVSRSHSGKVKNRIRNAFGNSTTIIEAGGAGEWSFTFI